ncbi:RNA polymerase sigma factor [Olivibacter sitiensis]|uniref:RNA polymerase sigma factor n=1 Tax=Olivibacter sitiensis TaxID=376470 RepID=UPI000426BBA7|nr:sigma-70 family RNA polymerase sigma factor [Olivibacter sitiensis]
MMHISDKDLLVRLGRQDDREAFRVLYSRYLHQVYNYAYAITADTDLSEEITQRIFIAVWEHRSGLSSVQHIKAYLLRATRNKLLNEIRKQGRYAAMKVAIAVADDAAFESPEETVILKEHLLLADRAIQQLPPKRKIIVELKTKEDLSLDEIAARLHISKNVVKKQLYKGLASVRVFLASHGELTISVVYMVAMIQNLG